MRAYVKTVYDQYLSSF